MPRVLCAIVLAAFCMQDVDLKKALKDKATDDWIYDDLDAGFALAKKTGKPMLVTLRCVM